MFLTIGMNDIPCTQSITVGSDLTGLDERNTYIFIHANGATRESWKKLSPCSPTFELEGVLPTVNQRNQLHQFINKGGMVVSSLINPAIPITTTAFCDEIPLDRSENLIVRRDGCTIEFEYSPYDWLPEELKNLPYEAYEFIHTKKAISLSERIIVDHSAESVMFNIGETGGKIIFTSLLNKANTFYHIQELANIYKILSRREKSYVTSR